MSFVRPLDVRFSLPLMVAGTFIMLGSVMAWTTYEASKSDLFDSSLYFVTHELVFLQGEIDKDFQKVTPRPSVLFRAAAHWPTWVKCSTR